MADSPESPDGCVLGGSSPRRLIIHIGPHKTGTTTIQSAFHANRSSLEAHGVHYLGARLQPTQAAKAMAGIYPDGPRRDAGLREWEEIMAELRATPASQVVVSSEFFCEADDEAARHIIEELGGDAEVRVVVTLRGLAKVLPSQWQQSIQTGSVRSLPDWLRWVLGSSGPESSNGIWRRHRHDRLIARWAGVVGPENVSVIVSDSGDPGQLPREFAMLVGVPPEILAPRTSVRNRSLTWEEAEGIRQFNITFRELHRKRAAEGAPPPELTSTQRLRAWGKIKRRPADPDHHRIALPEFAASPVEAIAREILANILVSGVQVIGPAEQLAERPEPSAWTPSDTGAEVPPRIATIGRQLMSASTQRTTDDDPVDESSVSDA